MGKLAKGTTTPIKTAIDWPILKAEIVAGLNVVAEYRSLGVKFATDTPNSKGFLECHALGRVDHSPSAAVNVKSGVYVDAGGEHLTSGFLDFALKFGRFGTWMDTVKYYAEKAGVTVGHAEFSGQKILEQIYRYRELDGSLSYGVFRYRFPNGKKDFRQYPWRKETWVKEKGCMEGVAPLPYRLPELAASPLDDIVVVVEGEKDADRLAEEGLTATTNHQGSKSTDNTWPRNSFLPHFKGRDVVVVPDNDKAGRDHAHRVCRNLVGTAARIRYLELPGLPEKGDVSDWFNAGHTVEEFGRLACRALDWSPELAADNAGDLPIIVGPDVKIDPADIVILRLSSVKPRAVRWLVPDKIPLGKLTLLAGDPGLGKSFITMDLAARLSVGGEIPGCPGECFDVASSLIFFAEDGADDTVVPRLMTAGANLDKIVTIESVRDSMGRLTPFNLSYMEHLDYALSTMPDCKLMILDPISNYIGRDADEHRNTEIRGVLTPLARLAEKRDIAIVLVTHINKGSTTKALSRITGSIAYSALCRSVWLIAKDKKDSAQRLMLAVKNNLAPDQNGLSYRIVDSKVVWDEEPVTLNANEALADPVPSDERRGPGRPTKSPEACEEWILGFLREQGPMESELVIAAGKAAGFGRNMVWEAKKESGVKAAPLSTAKGGPWEWHAPALAPVANGHYGGDF